MHKMILDTDIGTDVDDLMALSFLLGSPEIELLGVTTAYGDTRLRGKIVHRVLSLAGRSEVGIHAGESATLNGQRPIFWPGHEGKNAGVSDVAEEVLSAISAVDYLIETVRRFPGEVTICAIAPLGNLARAVRQAPEVMAGVKRVVMMGGVFGADEPGLKLSNRTEHNIRSDPESASVVFGFDWPITLFPLDVTTRAELTRADVECIGRAQTPLAALLHAELDTWLAYIAPRNGGEFTHMHDPLTVAAVVDPGLVTRSVKVKIETECAGELTTGMTVPTVTDEGNVTVVLEADVPRFKALFMERVTRSPAPPSQG